ncbi:ferrous iron transport protein A (plasmid) [Pseudoalteromonas xiamenensis]|uniref:FeoA family protein n=1 Tax=Pseudoalteromonas xiamenensis TaxID=882626 RepID=UPI0027E4A6F5|nr:FeoA family protein [Pseudoalteromonas xiamenensis]WMN61589.1 ferrous iron transport protein A [Pseudoalteromonas xiamenensis]
MTLNELKKNQTATISAINHPDVALVSRILALGIVPGEELKVLNVAPMGCPLQIQVGGTFVSIRKADAVFIQLSVK